MKTLSKFTRGILLTAGSSLHAVAVKFQKNNLGKKLKRLPDKPEETAREITE